MPRLSLTAQTVLNAFTEDNSLHDWKHNYHNTDALAAALRAVAEHCKCDDGEGYWIYRPNILAIADELESQ
jgi:hypothetical protein